MPVLPWYYLGVTVFVLKDTTFVLPRYYLVFWFRWGWGPPARVESEWRGGAKVYRPKHRGSS